MEHRRLGASGLEVPALSLGTGTFAGSGPLFGHVGSTDVAQATRLVDICLDAGLTMFDSADVYSDGAAEEVLGAALRGRRDRALISTKLGLPRHEQDPGGASRSRLLDGIEQTLRRLGTDRVDLLQLHAYDARTPVDEVAATLDTLVRSGKVRYVGASNYAGWQLMRALAAADRTQTPRPVAHQVYYSLVGRDYEWELMPLGAAEGVGAVVWSPLGWGRLTGRLRRGEPVPANSRLHATAVFAPRVDDEKLWDVTDALGKVAAETGRTVPQVAINWLLQRPTVSTVIVGARNEAQLRDNLGAVGWDLTPDQVRTLDEASHVPAPYPYAPYEYNDDFARLNPPLVPRVA